jgi:tetratricopeptide (TPR) repeat protein
MKKVVLTVVAAVFTTNLLFAQASAVTNAILYHKDGELDQAKKEINTACLNEKTSGKSKTWYWKGVIYEDIASSTKFSTSEPKALETSFNAYKKAMEVESSGEFFDMAKKRMPGIWGIALNNGIKKYQEEKLKEAIADYELAIQIKPQDTTAYVYAAYAAEGDNDYKSAEKYYNALKALNYKSEGMYKTLAYIAKDIEKNNDKALQILSEGRKYYPNDKDMMIDELNIYIATGRTKEAMGKMETAVNADPKNKMLHYNLGAMYDQAGEQTKAITSYQKALDIDANYFDANYNLGAVYYNQAAEKLSVANKMDFGTYQKEGKKIEEEAKSLFNKALPFFEKAHSLDSKDMNTMESLKTIYAKLGRNEDSMKILEKMEGKK